MNKDFDFQNLFVLDLANNHQGDVAHGRAVIAGHGEMVRKHGVRAAFKFQFRQLDSFIHPAHQEGSDNKHIPRFLSTRLSNDQFAELLAEVRKAGLLAMCTPFDEESVAVILDMGFDIIKVASCSAKDWPLLEAVADASLPVVISTGGLLLENIDDLVSFFDHRGVDYALMHCVSIYPIPDDQFHLNQIEILRERYPHLVIGWSTHEDPDATVPVHIAVAKGAQIFERHVGVVTQTNQLNAYSSTPDQVDKWFAAHAAAVKICGGGGARKVSEIEQVSIDNLRRGVYARKPIKQGVTVARGQVYFAMPYIEGQLESGRWKDDITANADFAPDSPLMGEALTIPENPDHHVIKTALHEVKALLNKARIALNSDFEVEYSHHHGIAEFRETGAVIINCINREYCKKILVQLPGQHHPQHFHKRKEETFQVLYGTLIATVEGHERILRPGETCLIQPGVWHSFWTKTGCVFEEVSTTHYNDDSYYKEKAINKMARSDRKTKVDHWGRFELSDKATSD
jgi:sialic acid synthase SpsE/quercetin dioxygenase-like cupin family protein